MGVSGRNGWEWLQASTGVAATACCTARDLYVKLPVCVKSRLDALRFVLHKQKSQLPASVTAHHVRTLNMPCTVTQWLAPP
jgi:hypothetical protein